MEGNLYRETRVLHCESHIIKGLQPRERETVCRVGFAASSNADSRGTVDGQVVYSLPARSGKADDATVSEGGAMNIMFVFEQVRPRRELGQLHFWNIDLAFLACTSKHTQQARIYGERMGIMLAGLLVQADGSGLELATAPLDGTILPGVTRDSILQLARSWNEFTVSERPITIREIKQVRSLFKASSVCGPTASMRD